MPAANLGSTGVVTPGPYKVSNSEIQTYKDCKRKWWFAYYRRLKPRTKKLTGPLPLGTRVHAALDEYYTTERPLLEAYADLLEKDRQTAIQSGVDPTEIESEGDMGRIMLEGYLEWIQEESIDADLEMISTEEILSMPMFDGSVELQGKIDMRVRRKADGVRMIRDFKTVGTTFEEFASTAYMNEQVLTYMLLERHRNTPTDTSEGAIFTLLKKNKRTARAKPPFYDQIEVRHNVFTLRAFWQRIHGTVGDMMRAKTALDSGASHFGVVPPHPGKDCRWKCPFYTVCPMVDDGSAAEQAIEAIYEVSDPYDYYADGKDGTQETTE
jgi:RecB family exonuclease